MCNSCSHTHTRAHIDIQKHIHTNHLWLTNNLFSFPLLHTHTLIQTLCQSHTEKVRQTHFAKSTEKWKQQRTTGQTLSYSKNYRFFVFYPSFFPSSYPQITSYIREPDIAYKHYGHPCLHIMARMSFFDMIHGSVASTAWLKLRPLLCSQPIKAPFISQQLADQNFFSIPLP